jgi:RNA recognition motif-containing protein
MEMQQMGSQWDDRTTVMMRNLPWNFRREDLIKEMDAKGFAGLYDFVYMPIDFKTNNCMGYAFANMVTTEEAQRLIDAFDGFKDWPHRSSKVCAASLSWTQGLEANVLRQWNSPLMTDEVPERFRPVLFSGTRRVPFLEFVRELPKTTGMKLTSIDRDSIRELLHGPADR